MGVVQDGVLDRADARARARGMAVPAEHHQVGARGVAGEHPGGMPADDVLADPNFRVLAVLLLKGGGQVAARLGRDPQLRAMPSRLQSRPLHGPQRLLRPVDAYYDWLGCHDQPILSVRPPAGRMR